MRGFLSPRLPLVSLLSFLFYTYQTDQRLYFVCVCVAVDGVLSRPCCRGWAQARPRGTEKEVKRNALPTPTFYQLT